MQRATLIKENDNLKKIIKKFKFVYIGGEFCQNLIPTRNWVDKIFKHDFKKIILFVPFCNEINIKKYKSLINYIIKNYDSERFEISTSDLGLIYYLNTTLPHLTKNIARPLSIEFVRMNGNELEKLIKRLKITAIETDEEIFINKIKNLKIKIYFHVPYKFLATQRNCPFVEDILSFCNKPCTNKEISLYVDEKKSDIIYLRNNTYFKKENKISSFDVDRIIITR